MDNLKERGTQLEDEKFEIENTINEGIEFYNKINSEKIPKINEYEYGISKLKYSFEEDSILITWIKTEYSCGEAFEEDFEKTIAYYYFEKEDNENSKSIEENKLNKEKLENEIKDLNISNERIIKEERIHRSHLFEAKNISKKYSESYISLKPMEYEIKKCESLIFLNNEKITKLRGELK